MLEVAEFFLLETQLSLDYSSNLYPETESNTLTMRDAGRRFAQKCV